LISARFDWLLLYPEKAKRFIQTVKLIIDDKIEGSEVLKQVRVAAADLAGNRLLELNAGSREIRPAEELTRDEAGEQNSFTT